MDLHDLTAGYALDALDPDERARYEEHLASCEPCRDGAAGVLAGRRRARPGGRRPDAARVAPRPDPRAGARRAAERRAAPPSHRGARPRSAAAVAALVAVALGVWSLGLSRDLDDANSVLAVLSDPNARVHPTADGEANLVVTPTGRAALVVRMLAPGAGGQGLRDLGLRERRPARVRASSSGRASTMLTRQVEPGQTVAVTLEPDGGVDAPTSDPLFTAVSA